MQPNQIKPSISSQNQPSSSYSRSSPPPTQPGTAQPAFGLSSFTKYLKDISSNISTKLMQAPGQNVQLQSQSPQQQQSPLQQSGPQSTSKSSKHSPPLRSRPLPPTRPAPPTRPGPPSRPPPPQNLLSSVEKKSQQTDGADDSSPERESVPNVVGDLLNLSLDESSNRIQSNNITGHDSEPQEEILLIDPVCDDRNNPQNNNNSAFDLLNDIFYSNGNQEQPPTGAQANLPKPDLLFPSSSSAANHFPSNSQPLHRNTSTPNLTQVDPFADLNSFVKPAAAGNTTPTSVYDIKMPPQGIPRVSSCLTFQSAPKPDYNRAHFCEPPSANPTGIPKVSGYEFEDLLSGFPKHPKQDSQTKSLAEMKKQELLREGISPHTLKVNEWKENKKRNIRALLSSLHTVVWDDCSWQPVGLQLLMSYNDVKKMYRKACLAVHPDKVSIA